MKLPIDKNKLMITKRKIQYLFNDLAGCRVGGPLHVYLDEPNLIDDFDMVISELEKDNYDWSDCDDKQINREVIKTCIDIVNDWKNMTQLEYFLSSIIEYKIENDIDDNYYSQLCALYEEEKIEECYGIEYMEELLQSIIRDNRNIKINEILK